MQDTSSSAMEKQATVHSKTFKSDYNWHQAIYDLLLLTRHQLTSYCNLYCGKQTAKLYMAMLLTAQIYYEICLNYYHSDMKTNWNTIPTVWVKLNAVSNNGGEIFLFH